MTLAGGRRRRNPRVVEHSSALLTYCPVVASQSPFLFGALQNPWRTRPAIALRQVLRDGYDRRGLRSDLIAGTIVGIVALPLSLALAIASGVPPQHGLYTAIVAGAVIAALGGSRVQVSGPTAAFVAVLAPIAAQYGTSGLLIATTMAGVILLLMGVSGLGGMVQYIPYPVTSGFTAGIALVIATLQVKDFLGLQVANLPPHYLERCWALIGALPTARWPEMAIGALTLFTLIYWPKLNRKVPSPLVALALAAVAAFVLRLARPDLAVDTIQTRFSYLVDGVVRHGIPRLPPMPSFPWAWPGPDGQPLDLSLALVRALAPAAFAIAMLGAIESLLSAVVADGMTGQTHDPDAELMAQGFGNIAAPFFGGIAATGAIARTATNVRSGARSPFAAIFHSVFVLLAVVFLAPLLGSLPMAALAALLLVIAWNMSEIRHVLHSLRVAPSSDSLVLVACFGLTVIFDMAIAVTFGVLLASLLFMKRMADVSAISLVGPGHPSLPADLPKGILVYEVTGALFFGAAQKAMSTLRTVQAGVKVVVLDLRRVSAIDATGLVNLESALGKLEAVGVRVIIGGLQHQPARALAKAGWRRKDGSLDVHLSFERAIEQAKQIVAPVIAPLVAALLLGGGVLSVRAESGIDPARLYPRQYYPGVADSSAAAGIQLRPGDASAELLLPLTASGGSIRGQLFVEAPGGSTPAAGVLVEALAGTLRSQTLTDAQGRFVVQGVPSGSAHIRYAGDSYLSTNKGTRAVFHPGCPTPGDCVDSAQAEVVSVVDGEETVLAVAGVTLRGARVGGRVTADGQPAADFAVLVSDDAQHQWIARTDATGRYLQAGLPEGAYHVLVDASGTDFVSEYAGGARTRELAEPIVLLEGDARADVDLQLDLGGTILGVVREEGTGRALVGAELIATETTTGAQAAASTNDLGLYSIRGLSSGSYRVYSPTIREYYPSGADPSGARAVRVIEPTTVSNIDLEGIPEGACRLAPPNQSHIFGTIEAAFDEMLRATIIAESDEDTVRLVVEAAGEYVVPCLRPAAYIVRLEPEGPYRTQYYDEVNDRSDATTLQVTIPPDTLTRVRFRPEASVVLRGRVVDGSSGSPLARVVIWAREDSSGAFAAAESEADGSFSLSRLPDGTGLPAGLWRVRAESTVVVSDELTPILQPAFEARALAEGGIELRWTLESSLTWLLQIDRLGQESADDLTRIASSLDAAQIESWVDRPGVGTHRYRLTATTSTNPWGPPLSMEAWSDPLTLPSPFASPADGLVLRPNPALGGQELLYAFPAGGAKLLRLLNAAGREVARVDWPAGASSIAWRALDATAQPLAAGVYFAQLRDPLGAVSSTRLVIVRGTP